MEHLHKFLKLKEKQKKVRIEERKKLLKYLEYLDKKR